MRFKALLLPEPQGPFKAMTDPAGDLILRMLLAKAAANGSIPKRSYDGVDMGWSLCERSFTIGPDP